jgi:S1-C subfamily serine protease
VRLQVAPIVLVGLFGALLGCTTTETPNAIASGVGIVADGCAGLSTEIGSGMTIERDGLVVTAAHTVAGATSIIVVDSEGNRHPASVAAFDKDADLALLEVPDLDTPPLSVGEAVLDDAIAVVWSRDDGVHAIPVRVTKRLNITIEDIYVEDEVRRSGLELSGDISFGDSGGAIVDTDGDIVGIVYAQSRQRPHTAFAIDHTELEGLLSDRPHDVSDRCQ